MFYIIKLQEPSNSMMLLVTDVYLIEYKDKILLIYIDHQSKLYSHLYVSSDSLEYIDIQNWNYAKFNKCVKKWVNKFSYNNLKVIIDVIVLAYKKSLQLKTNNGVSIAK